MGVSVIQGKHLIASGRHNIIFIYIDIFKCFQNAKFQAPLTISKNLLQAQLSISNNFLLLFICLFNICELC